MVAPPQPKGTAKREPHMHGWFEAMAFARYWMILTQLAVLKLAPVDAKTITSWWGVLGGGYFRAFRLQCFATFWRQRYVTFVQTARLTVIYHTRALLQLTVPRGNSLARCTSTALLTDGAACR